MPTQVEQTNQQTAEDKLPQPQRRHIFRRKNRKQPKRAEFDIKDDREPKIGFLSHFKVLQIFGWNLVYMAIGIVGAMAYGIIPIICQYILGKFEY